MAALDPSKTKSFLNKQGCCCAGESPVDGEFEVGGGYDLIMRLTRLRVKCSTCS